VFPVWHARVAPLALSDQVRSGEWNSRDSGRDAAL
jgi:hypothetical protein